MSPSPCLVEVLEVHAVLARVEELLRLPERPAEVKIGRGNFSKGWKTLDKIYLHLTDSMPKT